MSEIGQCEFLTSQRVRYANGKHGSLAAETFDNKLSGTSRISRMKSTIQCEHHATTASHSRALLLRGTLPCFFLNRRPRRLSRCQLFYQFQSN